MVRLCGHGTIDLAAVGPRPSGRGAATALRREQFVQEGFDRGEGLLVWPEITGMRPDRHFDTIACGSGGFCDTMARLAGGAVCVVPSPAWCERFVANEQAMCSSIAVGPDGRIGVERLRSLLAVQASEMRVVFNGWAGPYLCRPLGMGADVVVEDIRLWVSSHELPDPWASDPSLPCWALIARSASGMEQLAVELAENPSAFDVLSLRALSLVAQRRSDTALVAAHFLAAHPRVAWVSYPGLAGDAAHEAARSTLEHGFGPLVAFGCEGECDCRQGRVFPGDRSVLTGGLAAGTYVLCAGLENPLDCVAALEAWLTQWIQPA